MEKPQIESKSFPVFVIGSFVAYALLVTGFFVPYWIGNDTLGVYNGLWFVRICTPQDCQNLWYINHADRIPEVERWDVVRAFETLAVIAGVFSLVFGVLMITTRHKTSTSRHVTQGLFFATSLLAGLMAVVGVLVFIATITRTDMMWAPSLPALGGLLFFMCGVFTLVICRYDPHDTPDGTPTYVMEQTSF
ncbi:uncharacterized protein LOC124151404 [Haliotis rufescens]|uniref:uncharacterized protein LOC124151404 n=1 Tax=Haliotis rufescens TaxID=6454 RepID=UPI00201FAC6B|nr:uncharacterized protein LOC124151404 [Haliotis rufescens]